MREVGSSPISNGFDKSERKRFHNLLKLAAESPFEGEREAALAAAKRLAAKHNMDLRDAAAQSEPEPDPEENATSSTGSSGANNWTTPGYEPPPGFEERWGQTKRSTEAYTTAGAEAEKRRWRAAYDAARRRGLDEGGPQPQAKPKRSFSQPKSKRRMNPLIHARTLIQETTLPLAEIAGITQLSMHEIVALKLKLRAEEKKKASARR